MTSSIDAAAAATPLTRPSWVLGRAACTLRALAQGASAWLEARRRTRADYDALALMSDRDLIDIGIDRASVRAVAEGAWLRDHPY